ncbi:hypothetical protein SODALDRAFT_163953 [Sodiomyces alkalinus F11]|uniref:Secreted protein n=1 Tax=Sodiomyces alkalinus (strain CBS 110278 / VKM F-3762 / F11) TaxID=1314773 RepID=A0A3N2PVI0_SODAK|nr:hypothetical protein SODALDRAFT_163953 [Sodiomyces alkalinus F11]ROT38513.1 hypothetical protein SODALDRAFT_163953 [Sodiomyces alkalinus F11]
MTRWETLASLLSFIPYQLSASWPPCWRTIIFHEPLILASPSYAMPLFYQDLRCLLPGRLSCLLPFCAQHSATGRCSLSVRGCDSVYPS